MRKGTIGLLFGLMLTGCASYADTGAQRYAAAHPQAALAERNTQDDARAHGFGRPRFPSH